MVSVGVVGLGVMGRTHLDAYAQVKGIRIAAVADLDASRLNGTGDVRGNIDGQAGGQFDLTDARRYREGMDLIRDPDVELIDVCLTTPLHESYTIAAIESGKHVIVEKPLARTSDSARRILEVASRASGRAMCALCMRFWPGWDWLKQAVDTERYGRVRSAVFQRISEHPGGPFYSDATLSGGALLDLHIHDTDFICYLLGVPESVTSVGYNYSTGGIDHVTTFYHYRHAPHIVAEGGWTMSKGFGFRMRYTVRFDRATVMFDRGAQDSLMLIEDGKQPVNIRLDVRMGYTHEIQYLIDCIRDGKTPERASLTSATQSLLVVEAEEVSVRSGRREPVTIL